MRLIAHAGTGEKRINVDPAESSSGSDRSEVERLTTKARSQYFAGDLEAAENSFRALEEREPENEAAKKFLRRIAKEKTSADISNREKTRARLLDDVTKSWERPAEIPARNFERETTAVASPLARKLNEIVLPSVNFTRAEIGEVVAALSAISEEFDTTGQPPKGVNIVLLDAAGKTPTVTLTLRNSSLKRVLDFVSESIGYHYELQADAVVLRPGGEASTLDTAFFPVTRAAVLRMTGSNGAVNTSGRKSEARGPATTGGENVSIRDGEGLAMKTFLRQAGVSFETVPGSGLAYDGSTLIVTQTPRNLERIHNILSRYSNVRQVQIEAKFMEVQDGALEELGVNWSIAQKATQHGGAKALYQTSGRTLASAFGNSTSTQQGSIVRPSVPETDSSPAQDALNIPIINNAPSIPGVAALAANASPLASIAGIIGEFDVNAVVRALSQKQGTDLLSAPRVTVLSGNPATITVAQEMRYPQSFGQTQSQVGTGSASGGGSAGVAITAGTPQEFTSRNVGVELRVTPTVEEDDYSISLDLNPRVTEFDGFVEYGGSSIAIAGGTTVTVPSGFYQPIFSVRDISTKVTIWDGATLVMGGLTREEVKKVNDKVPLLGDLPLIGRVFRSKGESSQKRNLLIFVTANLVNPGGSAKRSNLRSASTGDLFENATIVPTEKTRARDAAVPKR